jgi:alpha-1,2-mannosyltransferase
MPVLAATLAAEVVVLALGLRHRWLPSILYTEAAAAVLFAVAVFALSRCRLAAKPALLVVLASGALLSLVTMTTGPTTSDDVNRYIWDAKVQLHGVDPYRYPPSAPELDPLRGSTLFYPATPNCVWKLPDGRCSEVNRPEVRTVYPPVAEAGFTLARLASFGRSDGPFPLQVLGALGVLALSLLLSWRALGQQRPAWTVALWSWCPVTLVESVNNAHIDWLAAVASVAGLIAYGRGRSGLAGTLLGAAIATKLYPALLLPALFRRHPVRVIGAAVGVLVLGYLPHVLAVGSQVIGYLPGYLREEDYTDGGRFLLLAAVLPKPVLTAAAAVILLATALWVARRTDPHAPEDFAVTMVGIALLVATPSYSWYLVFLLGLAAMTGRIEWLPLVIAPTFATLGAANFGNGIGYRTGCYAVALAAVVLATAIRWRWGAGRFCQTEPSLQASGGGGGR